MESAESKEDEQPFIQAKVYIEFITSSDPRFDKLVEDHIDNIPVNKSEMVIPVFEIAFNDRNTIVPHGEVGDMIKKAVDEQAKKDDVIPRVMRQLRPEDVLSMPPYRMPKTDSLRIADVSITPDYDGVIVEFDSSELQQLAE